MKDNVRQLKKPLSQGLTQVESIEDAHLALLEMEGECETFLIELDEIAKLENDAVNVFLEIWRDRLSVMMDRAQACQMAIEKRQAA